MRKLETISNIAVICTALLFSYVLVTKFVMSPPPSQSTIPHPAEGKHLSLAGVDWSANKRTLVMAMSSHCGFCVRSTPFYQKLGSSADLKSKRVGLIAVLPDDPATNSSFLDHYKVKVDQVINSQLASINVEATPTLLLVNSKGVVEREWIGMLDSTAESQVRSQLFNGR